MGLAEMMLKCSLGSSREEAVVMIIVTLEQVSQTLFQLGERTHFDGWKHCAQLVENVCVIVQKANCLDDLREGLQMFRQKLLADFFHGLLKNRR